MASDLLIQADIALRNAHNLQVWHTRKFFMADGEGMRDLRPVQDRLRWCVMELQLIQRGNVLLKPQAF